MKGIYLAAYKDFIPDFDIDYNDISKTSEHINIVEDMMKIDISNYDFVIAYPPCNYYSRCNYRRYVSEYALKTKHLLPDILEKLGANFKKPFIVENVRNPNIMNKMKVFEICNKYNINIYEYGRHTYFTNIFIDFHNIPQRYDFYNHGIKRKYNGKIGNIQGGYNVHNVFNYWLEVISQ